MVSASTILILGFTALAVVDGLYIHLWRLRLHSRPQSWREHLWHTLRAALFVPILLTIFAAPTAGAVLWIGVALLAADLLAELLDVRSERASRADLGGVGRGELAVHVVAATVHAVAVLLALAARPAEAWSLAAPAQLGAYPAWVGASVGALVPGSLAGAALHGWLAWRHRPCCRAVLA